MTSPALISVALASINTLGCACAKIKNIYCQKLAPQPSLPSLPHGPADTFAAPGQIELYGAGRGMRASKGLTGALSKWCKIFPGNMEAEM